MHLRTFIALGLSAIAGATLAAAPATSTNKPNLVYFLADDIGVGEFGCFGGKVIPTPNIDRLAREGLRFTNAYAGSAVCAPTRCVLMTGQHTGHALRRANVSRNGLLPLPPGTITVARMLQGAGYATGGFGKWGLGDEGTTGAAEKQGFDLFYGYYDQVHAHSYFPAELVRNGVREALPGNANEQRGQYAHDLIEAETLRFIEANRDRPFFCYAAWTLPHAKYEIPSHAQFDDRPWSDTLKICAAMIARLDAAVGAVMAKLKELGIEERTLLIFTATTVPISPTAKSSAAPLVSAATSARFTKAEFARRKSRAGRVGSPRVRPATCSRARSIGWRRQPNSAARAPRPMTGFRSCRRCSGGENLRRGTRFTGRYTKVRPSFSRRCAWASGRGFALEQQRRSSCIG